MARVNDPEFSIELIFNTEEHSCIIIGYFIKDQKKIFTIEIKANEFIPDEKFNSTQFDFDIYGTDGNEDDTLEVDSE